MTDDDLDAAYDDCLRRLDEMTAQLATATPSTASTLGRPEPKDAPSRTPAGEYRPAVLAALEAVKAGEVFQIQVGQRFSTPTTADPFDIYRVLRILNPSPYMYFLRVGAPAGIDIVGCSPEALVTVHGDQAVLHPIAGTRRRGETPEEDAAMAAELVSDTKEQAEHVMLVDLARNDLGRVAAPGTVAVAEFGAVERYSHVWHIVSTVTATVADGQDAFDVLRATFPAGTLTGAPKVRAMELIEELEPVRRGVYGGAVGYLDATGELDMAIAIRTAVVRDGIAHVQASAGIVADSRPELEEQETRNKARAVLQAIATAETLRPVTPAEATPAEATPADATPAERDTGRRDTSRRGGAVTQPSAPPRESAGRTMGPDRRELTVAVIAVAAGGGLALLAAARTWSTVTVLRAAPFGPLTADVDGRTLQPAVTGLAVVALAGVLALLATRGVVRQLVGAVLVLTAVGTIWRAALGLSSVSSAHGRQLVASSRTGATLGNVQSVHVSMHPIWALLAVLGGVLVLVGGVVTAARGGRWRAMSSRYESPVGSADGRSSTDGRSWRDGRRRARGRRRPGR